jgi:hemin uptake protein HemP
MTSKGEMNPCPQCQDSRETNAKEMGKLPAAHVISAEQLFRGHREVLIEHAGERYRLRLTRRNKLILQKQLSILPDP